MVNGNSTSNFTYLNGVVNLNINLLEGANVVEVTGVNSAGTDSKSTTFVYHKEQNIDPPIVTYSAPSANPTSVTTPSYFVQATVANVYTKDQIVVSINGANTSNFTFENSSKSWSEHCSY